MEQLENKIQKLISEDGSILVLSKPTLPRMSKLIASEVKDIAIAFAWWRQSNYSDNFPSSDDELFTKFLTTYYK